MSLYVITTQAFSVTSEPVIVDWQYDTWGDSVITVDSSNIVANTADDYDIDITFANSIGTEETRTVRIELVYSDGTRVERTGQSNSDPDDDSKWLVAEQVGLAIPGSGSATTSVHSFIDDKVSDVVAGGGYFMVYTNENSGVWTSGNYINEEVIHSAIDAPDPVLTAPTQTIRPSSYTEAGSAWTNPTLAYDLGASTVASQTSGDIRDTINFLPWATDGAGSGTINQVDISIEMQVAGFAASKNIDTLTVAVYVSGAATGDSTVISADFNSIITYTAITEPGDGSWSWADITNIEVRLTGAKMGGLDTISTWEITDVSGTVNP